LRKQPASEYVTTGIGVGGHCDRPKGRLDVGG
jgi:hypothetical protein